MSSNDYEWTWENDREHDVIEAVMYVALGFCTAGLIGLAILPAFYRRAARLTEEALRAVNPSSYAEVRAAQDQARARHAIELRRVERQLDDERAKAAKHHLEASRLRTEIDVISRTHKSQVSDLESKLGSLHGDQKAVDLLTAEVKVLKEKLAETEKALAESWKTPADTNADVGTDAKKDGDDDWLPAADTMALATITGLEAEVATLKARLAKYDPTVASEIDADQRDGKKTRLSRLEAQLVDTESKYVTAQAEVTRLSLMLENDGLKAESQADSQDDTLTEQLDELKRENVQQKAELTSKDRALDRFAGQIEKLQKDLAGTPALVQLRQEFRALAEKLAGPGSAPGDEVKATEPLANTASDNDKVKKRTQRVMVQADKPKKPASIRVKATKIRATPKEEAAPKSAEIASAAEALVSRIVASNRKSVPEEKPAESKQTAAETEAGSDPGTNAKTKSSKQKKKDVA
ncbi:hypothetical protein [uncultured Roseibium sp.]|uniref:hypothetical protein n=1 Tax=uncultured Roseibium sp. TaxID=1936171 RepID=UPI00261FEBDD|nr:hypothetical protein [uncultured Roseibium sp.]